MKEKHVQTPRLQVERNPCHESCRKCDHLALYLLCILYICTICQYSVHSTVNECNEMKTVAGTDSVPMERLFYRRILVAQKYLSQEW